MVMVGVDGSSLPVDSYAKAEGWWPSGAQSAFIKLTGWTLAIASPWWQRHKHCHW